MKTLSHSILAFFQLTVLSASLVKEKSTDEKKCRMDFLKNKSAEVLDKWK